MPRRKVPTSIRRALKKAWGSGAGTGRRRSNPAYSDSMTIPMTLDVPIYIPDEIETILEAVPARGAKSARLALKAVYREVMSKHLQKWLAQKSFTNELDKRITEKLDELGIN